LTGLEDLGDFRVHIDHHVLLGLDFGVPLLHLALHPQSEGIAGDGVYDISYILSRQFFNLLLDWEIARDGRKSSSICLHVFDGQSLELRYIEVFDLVALNSLFRTRLDILQVPDGHILKWWEVDIDLRSQETVHFSFALELRG
jgi:hypothetical protein